MVTLDKRVPPRTERETPAEAQRRHDLSMQGLSRYHQIRRERPSTVEVRNHWRSNHRPWWRDSWGEAKVRKIASWTPNLAFVSSWVKLWQISTDPTGDPKCRPTSLQAAKGCCSGGWISYPGYKRQWQWTVHILMIMTDFPAVLSFVYICSLEANGGRVSEIVCLHNQTPFNESRIDCLVTGKGQASDLSSLVTVANQRKHCTICFVFCSQKRRVCCNRIRDVLRGKIYMFKILSWVSDF